MGILSALFKKNKHKLEDFLKRDFIFLDVRTKPEWDKAHIESAIHIPLSDLKNNIEKVKNLKKPVIVYCRSGLRSAKALELLKRYDIEAVNGGGMNDLKQLI